MASSSPWPGQTKAAGGFPGTAAKRLLEGDALVPRKDRLAESDEAVALADQRRNVAHVIPARLPLDDPSPQQLERLKEERLDVVRLEPPHLGPLHFLANAVHPRGVHRLACQGRLLEEVPHPSTVKGVAHDLSQSRLHVGELAIADGFQQEIPQGLPFELQLPEHIENLPAEGVPGFFQLLQQRVVDVALARLLRDQVPEVADLRLPDSMDAPEPLLDAVGVPGEVVIHHQVGALQVDALGSCVRRQEDLHARVVPEGLLDGAPILAPDPAMDHHHGLLPAEEGHHPVLQIVERVPVFGEDDELLVRGWDELLAWLWGTRQTTRWRRGGGEQPAQERCELLPLPVFPAPADALGQCLEPLEDGDLGLKLADRPRRGRAVENFLLGGVALVAGGVLQVFDVLIVEPPDPAGECRLDLASTLEHL